MAANSAGMKIPRSAALKDKALVYRACTIGYARDFQLSSPSQLVGLTDSDILEVRRARLLQGVEQRILATGIAEITSGDLLDNQVIGRYFVRKPIRSDSGNIVGIEIHSMSLDDLDESYRLLISRSLRMSQILNISPYGVLVHRGRQTLYTNQGWPKLLNQLSKPDTITPFLRDFLAADEELPRSAVLDGKDGKSITVRFHKNKLRWNGALASVVFCYSETTDQNSPIISNTADGAGFVEKRRGRRREVTVQGAASALQDPSKEASLFAALRYPVLVCDNWRPLYANKAAARLLGSNNDQRIEAVDNWFNDHVKAEVDAMLQNGDADQTPVPASVVHADKRYAASLSPVAWAGRSAVLVSLQEVTSTEREIDELSREVRKLEDFASSAGDFFWEMDSEQRMTQLSMEVRPLLGISSKSLIGVPLETLIERHVLADDVAQWSVLTVDMRNHLPFRDREYKWQHKDGSLRVVRLSGVPVFGASKVFLGYRGIGSDFTAEFNDASVMAYHASHDALTGLVNRREFESRCDQAVEDARNGQSTHALCFLDLDKFKAVNDTCGHLAGDELLRQLSGLFAGLVRRSDVLARLGGDEFGVLIFNVGINEALRLANQLRAEVESYQFLWENRIFSVGASIGLVIVDNRWENRSAVFGAADAACYEAKNLGRNRVAVYKESETSNEINQGERQWAELINSAIAENRVRLCMQKIIALQPDDDELSRVELCMRIKGSDGELILPAAFLPPAERYGLSCKLDRAVVERAIDWLEGQPHVADSMRMCTINISRQSIVNEEFMQFLLSSLRAAAFDVSILCFEISEADAIANLSAATQFMKRVGELGCEFSLDDIGGGLSSFGYLKNLPVTYLKIDGRYIRNILDDAIDFAMVKAINEIGQSLGLITIAEHVESEAVLDKLSELGVNLAQGYHIGNPEIIDF